MSKGWGERQQVLADVLRSAEKPLTFDEICRIVYPRAFMPGKRLKPSIARSTRRALKGFVDGGVVLALGEGGPGDPKRYFSNPMTFAVAGSREEYEAAVEMLKESPGGVDAINKAARAMCLHATANSQQRFLGHCRAFYDRSRRHSLPIGNGCSRAEAADLLA